MKSGRYLHYFDTCIFLHWLSDPQKDQKVVDGIEDIVTDAEQHRSVIIVTSIITRIEVLRTKLTPNDAERFARMLRQFTIQTVNVDTRVAQLAHDIRDYYQSQSPPIKLKTPDCIHLATAIYFECDEMNTLDGCGDRVRPSDLLKLNENVMGGKYPLIIKKPARKPPPPPPPEPEVPPLFKQLVEAEKQRNNAHEEKDDEKVDEKVDASEKETRAAGQDQPAAESGRGVDGAPANPPGAEKPDKKDED